MATDEVDSTPSPLDGEVDEGAEPGDGTNDAVVGSYTWNDFLREHGEADAARALYQRFDETPGSERWGEEDRTLTLEDWERTDVDPAEYLGFPPWEIDARIGAAYRVAADITDYSSLIGYEQTPVIKDIYGWEDYKREYFYTDEGEVPTDKDGEPEEFDAEEALGLPPETIDQTMADCKRAGEELQDLIDERTVDVDEEIDEDAFFSDTHGRTTVANRYDLEKTVPLAKKAHFREEDRYWVNKPYSFVVIFHSTKENEIKYYVVQPHLTEIEKDLTEYMTDKLRASIKYEDEGQTAGDEDHRRSVIENKTRELLDRYDLYDEPEGAVDDGGFGNRIADTFGLDPSGGVSGRVVELFGYEQPTEGIDQLEGIEARPEPKLIEEDADILNEYQVEKLLYYLERDFIGYERIDGIKHDINVEDISCDGYNSPVFVYHTDYEQIITNVYHGEDELDDFVVKLAQRSGKGISKRRPQVDATLPDGSRAQLTLGREVSDHGTNYTIRQFKDVPFTPIDLINWQTFSLDEMAFLWLCIENHKSLIFAGGTASGKTTSLNAVSLFIPSNTKIVSIEDTREVELPQRNWIASVTRPSFSDDDKGDVDEFDLLEAALRQRPDYIVMGEIRGEEGRTLFQVMSTGHTTYTTFHADNVGEVLKRFTTEPINVSKTMFTALDLVSVQTSTRVHGQKVRRNKSLTEINHYDAENDEINVQDVYQWQAETDEFLRMGNSNTLDEIMFDRGWDRDTLDLEMFKRQTVLAYLIHEGLNTYTQVAATFQAFINDPETILSLMANDLLESSLEDLREMESVLIDIDPEKEEMVPRPDPNDEILAETREILDRAEEELFEQYHGEQPDDVADALIDTQPQGNVQATPDAAGELPAGPDENVDISAVEPDHAALDDGDDEADADSSMPQLESGEPVEVDEPADEQTPDSDHGTDTDTTEEDDWEMAEPLDEEAVEDDGMDADGLDSDADQDEESGAERFDEEESQGDEEPDVEPFDGGAGEEADDEELDELEDQDTQVDDGVDAAETEEENQEDEEVDVAGFEEESHGDEVEGFDPLEAESQEAEEEVEGVDEAGTTEGERVDGEAFDEADSQKNDAQAGGPIDETDSQEDEEQGHEEIVGAGDEADGWEGGDPFDEGDGQEVEAAGVEGTGEGRSESDDWEVGEPFEDDEPREGKGDRTGLDDEQLTELDDEADDHVTASDSASAESDVDDPHDEAPGVEGIGDAPDPEGSVFGPQEETGSIEGPPVEPDEISFELDDPAPEFESDGPEEIQFEPDDPSVDPFDPDDEDDVLGSGTERDDDVTNSDPAEETEEDEEDESDTDAAKGEESDNGSGIDIDSWELGDDDASDLFGEDE